MHFASGVVSSRCLPRQPDEAAQNAGFTPYSPTLLCQGGNEHSVKSRSAQRRPHTLLPSHEWVFLRLLGSLNGQWWRCELRSNWPRRLDPVQPDASFLGIRTHQLLHALRLLAKHASGQYITGNSVDTSLGAHVSLVPQYRSRGSCNGAAVRWGCAAAVDLGFAVVGPDVGPSRRVRTGANAANDAVAGMMSSDGWR